MRTLIDPCAPDPRYVGLLGFGGYADDSGVSTPSDTMYFVSGKRAFLGYWTQPDGGVVWFSNLPRETPLDVTEARAIASSVGKALMAVVMPIAMKAFLTPQRMVGWTHGHRIGWHRVVPHGSSCAR